MEQVHDLAVVAILSLAIDAHTDDEAMGILKVLRNDVRIGRLDPGAWLRRMRDRHNLKDSGESV